MKNMLRFSLLLVALTALAFLTPVAAQVPGNVETEQTNPTNTNPPKTESSEPEQADPDAPLNDVVEQKLMLERRLLPYDPVRESDILWKKWVWRVIDIREKINLPFAYPEEPFFTILMNAAQKGEITVYSQEDDKFKHKLSPEEVQQIGASIDTVYTVDPETYEDKVSIVRNELNPEDVKRFRIKEVWYFDEESSTLKVRILGIAPLMDKKDDAGNFLYEQVMFWAYYPDCRELLSRHQVFNAGNDASPMSWEDLMELRLFSSYIFKESNVYDRRIINYLTGNDMLMEGEKIKLEIFNYEHDLWQY